MTIQEKITQGRTFLGIEFGSTRIKAALIDETLRSCYADLKRDVRERCGVTLDNLGAIGVSAMMHGYMPFDKDDKLLVPFRTWRNTTTEKAASELTELFGFNIPQRWSVAHLYQAVLDNEPHIGGIAYISTLAGYIHYLLTGGVGEASGMFPINGVGYDREMLGKLDKVLGERNVPFKTEDVLPRVMTAGERCGELTEQGAVLLDPALSARGRRGHGNGRD